MSQKEEYKSWKVKRDAADAIIIDSNANEEQVKDAEWDRTEANAHMQILACEHRRAKAAAVEGE